MRQQDIGEQIVVEFLRRSSQFGLASVPIHRCMLFLSYLDSSVVVGWLRILLILDLS